MYYMYTTKQILTPKDYSNIKYYIYTTKLILTSKDYSNMMYYIYTTKHNMYWGY